MRSTQALWRGLHHSFMKVRRDGLAILSAAKRRDVGRVNQAGWTSLSPPADCTPQRAIILAALAPLGFVVVLLPWRVGEWRSTQTR